MCLSCGVEINVYDVSSLIMEGRGLREPCLAVLWEEAHLQACRGAPAFSCGAAVKQICTIALMTHVLWCSFPHSPYTSMDCYFLLLFLLSIYYPKFKSALQYLCAVFCYEIVQLPSSLVPHLPQWLLLLLSHQLDNLSGSTTAEPFLPFCQLTSAL